MPAMPAATEPCRACGRRPTRQFVVRRHVGLLISARYVKFRGPLCRDDAEDLTKTFLRRTLAQGWWGYLSVFVNFFVICTDLVQLWKAKRMPAPEPVTASDSVSLS